MYDDITVQAGADEGTLQSYLNCLSSVQRMCMHSCLPTFQLRKPEYLTSDTLSWKTLAISCRGRGAMKADDCFKSLRFVQEKELLRFR